MGDIRTSELSTTLDRGTADIFVRLGSAPNCEGVLPSGEYTYSVRFTLSGF